MKSEPFHGDNAHSLYEVAKIAREKSSSTTMKVGCAISNNDMSKISWGWNKLPRNLIKNVNTEKYTSSYFIHAEIAAIMNTTFTENGNYHLAVTLFPCMECAKAILQQTNIKTIFTPSMTWHEKNQPKRMEKYSMRESYKFLKDSIAVQFIDEKYMGISGMKEL